ncbi:HMG (high mobility group) box protein [Rhizoctonia solani]|uniref:HMG (High mobility group) box protein n=1 Tax=Rhizoctonia solani TaxID=456999 RepID=A0A8H8PBB7_9AGAM|nr:HMG (high mobility group) box protein [Rhizoctonia solani]QRW27607.1 HMG (high mobility group) box protein [Rhizoctonia solani]
MSIDDFLLPKRTRGTDYRSRLIVISDSESDSDLPPPSLLLQDHKAAGPAPNVASTSSTDEIINISSDSEVERTPTKSHGSKPPSDHGLSGFNATSSTSNAISVLTRSLQSTHSLQTDSSPDEVNPTAHSQSDKAASSQPTGSNDTESEVNETRLFDKDVYHPGILRFDPGPRRPALVNSLPGTSISTQKESDGPQNLRAKGKTRAIILVDSLGERYFAEHPEDLGGMYSTKSSKVNSIENANSCEGYGPVQTDISEITAPPETPRPRPRPKPKPKAPSAVLASASVPAMSSKIKLNDSVFDGKLPSECPIEWSKKLNTTAGRAHWKRIRDANGRVTRHDTRIELSTKVVDCEGFFRSSPSYGIKESKRIMKARPDISISVSAFLFSGLTYWQLIPPGLHMNRPVIRMRYPTNTNGNVPQKNVEEHMVDTASQLTPKNKHVAPAAASLFHSLKHHPSERLFKARVVSVDYLKLHMKEFKAANPGIQHGEVMKRLGEMFRVEKDAAVDEELDQVMAGVAGLGIESVVD